RSHSWSRLRSGKGLLGALGAAAGLTMVNVLILSQASFFEDGDISTGVGLQLAAAAALIAIWSAVVELVVPSPQKTLQWESFPLALDDNALLPVLSALGALTVFQVLGLGECRLKPYLLW
ncbi:unnamed protein product, partial [Discosporangium mesarthrocarpum]